mgnify:CR=1 FL=1|jgi:hypothetical protein
MMPSYREANSAFVATEGEWTKPKTPMVDFSKDLKVLGPASS